MLGAVNYGRDCDSIATMAGAIAGALHGESAVPEDWAKTVAEASRIDLHAPARELAEVTREVFARDTARRRSHESAFALPDGHTMTGLRLTWVQPEDLLGHELRQAEEDGRDAGAIRTRWTGAGGSLAPPSAGASPAPAPPQLRALARDLLDELAVLPSP